ncbi:MAG: hypothetical protein ABIK28_13510 [Planctomycetota bacterium]
MKRVYITLLMGALLLCGLISIGLAAEGSKATHSALGEFNSPTW